MAVRIIIVYRNEKIMAVFLKDDKLAHVYDDGLGNIAQYISVGPDSDIRHIKIRNFSSEIYTLKELILLLINSSRSKSINIRSFSPNCMKGNKLVYDKRINDLDEILKQINENCKNGKYSIINENIDINDGGVSGVVLGNMIEFSPKDTPKCVEKEGVCLLEKRLGYHLLETVYGFTPEFNFDDDYRVEFSIHPTKEGLKQTHTIVWEYELFEKNTQKFELYWPNNFSKFLLR